MHGPLTKLEGIEAALEFIETSSTITPREMAILVHDGNISRLKCKFRRLKKLTEYEPKQKIPEAKELTFQERLELRRRGGTW
jgi:hypothetical protein